MVSSRFLRRTINGKWTVGRRLGEGGFGEVYEAEDRRGHKVVVKVDKQRFDSLTNENRVYRILRHAPDFPRKLHFGDHCGYRILVIERLGESIGDIIKRFPGGLSRRTVLRIGIQVAHRLETMHERRYIHSDLHPGNIMIGRASKRETGKLYLLDFGNSKEYKDQLQRHISFREGFKRVGTFRFASPNQMEGKAMSRRDDLLSLSYCLVYLYLHALPWDEFFNWGHVPELNRRKRNLPSSVICRGAPRQLARFLDAARSLDFTDKPNYSRFRSILRSGLRGSERYGEGKLDWQ